MMTKFSCMLLALCATAAFAQQAPVTTSLWSIPTSTSTSTSSTQPWPVVFNGTTIFANVYSNSGSYTLNTLNCVNDTTGAVIWSYVTGTAVQSLGLRGTVIIAQGTTWIAGVSPQGAQLWNLSATAVNYTFPTSTPQVPPLLSTDSNTLYTYGTTTNSSGIFTVFAVDLTSSAPALTPVFSSTSSSFYYASSLYTTYLVPVNGSDFLFLFGTGQYYFNLNASNFSDPRYSTTKTSCSYCYTGNPVVDPVNWLVYMGGTNNFVVNDFVSGIQNASVAMSLNGTGTGYWQTTALMGTRAANGAVTMLSGFAATSYYDRSVFYQVLPFNGSSSLQYGAVVATSQSTNYQNTLIGGDASNPNSVIAYVVDTKGNFAAFNVSSFTWLWTTPTPFQTYISSGGSVSDPTLRAYTFVNGKVYAVLNGRLLGTGTSGSRRDTLLALNPTTGAYTAQYSFSSSFSTMWLASDQYTPLGASIVAFSSNAQLTSVLGTAISTGATFPSGPISTRVLYANDAFYFGTGGVNLTCVGATNGTLLFVTPVITGYSSSSSYNDLNPTLAPVLANGKIFLAASGYYSSNAWTIYVVANSGNGAVTTIASSTYASACSSTSSVSAYGPLVVSPDQSYIYFSGGGGGCIVQIATTGTYTASASNTKSGNRNYAPPLPIGTFIYYSDYYGNVKYTRASSFSSTTLSVTANKISDYYPSEFSYYNGQLYFAADDAVYKYDGTLLAQQWTAAVPSGQSIPTGYGIGAYSSGYSQSAPAGFFRGNVYTIVQNGSSYYGVAAYNAAGALVGSTTTALFTTFLPGASTRLTYPAISPDGIFVFASSSGVFAMTYQGKYLWSRTDGGNLDCSDYTNYPTAYQIPTIRNGVIYVICNNALHLMDLYRNGTDWQVGSYNTYTTTSQSPYYNYGAAGVQYFVNPDPNTNQVVTISQSAITIANVSGQLYTAAQLPPALAPFDQSLLDEIKDNKLWIAGAVLGAVVVVIIIVVAKKMSGGGAAKKDTDYVTMSNMEKPVNAV